MLGGLGRREVLDGVQDCSCRARDSAAGLEDEQPEVQCYSTSLWYLLPAVQYLAVQYLASCTKLAAISDPLLCPPPHSLSGKT